MVLRTIRELRTMRISIPIAAGGGRSNTRMPMPSASLDECLGVNGKIDRAKAQLALSDRKFFCPSSEDDEFVYIAALTLLGTIHDAYQQIEARPDATISSHDVCKQDTLNSRKAERKRKIAWLNERRLMCKCRCASGHCSPIHPTCRFYDKGMCNEITEVK